MSKLKLINNDQANWTKHEYYFDGNGQAHAQHLHWGDDYTLEDGSAIDDIDAILDGVILGSADQYDEYQEEWN